MENKQMKITKARLKTIIMEELASVMREQEFGAASEGSMKIFIPQDAGEINVMDADEIDDDKFKQAVELALEQFAGRFPNDGIDYNDKFITIERPSRDEFGYDRILEKDIINNLLRSDDDY
jgi:hypothetical protein